MTPVQMAASDMLKLGLMPIPVKGGTKAPAAGSGWQNKRYSLDTDDLAELFPEGMNIGLNLGASEIVDVDLDSLWALSLWPQFLPETPMRWGRKSSRCSHHAYRVEGKIEHKAYDGVKQHGDKKTMLLEVRAGAHQTVIPPSIHPSGERIEWEGGQFIEPVTILADDLKRQCGLLAACALIASVWCDPSTHRLALGLTGFLLKKGMNEREIYKLLKKAWIAARDPEPRDREQAIVSTVKLHRQGKPIEGARAILEALPAHGEAVMRKLEDWLALGPTSGEKPIIVTNTYKDWDDLVQQSFSMLSTINAPDPTLFYREAKLTRVRLNEHGHPFLERVSEAALKGHLASIIFWVIKTKTGYAPVQPPDDVVKTVLARSKWTGIPALLDIVEAPIFSPDGTITTTPGYQPSAQVWYDPRSRIDVKVPERPTPPEVGAAAHLILHDVLRDFMFDTESSRANAVAAICMPFARNLFSGPTPLHLISAPVQGSGKGLLSNIIHLIVTGRPAEVATMPDGDEELRKRITSILRRSSPVIVLDNLKGKLEGAALEAVLTSVWWTDRVLGVSETTGALPNRSLWVATGNNVETSTDIARRIVTCRLDPGMERPWQRTDFLHPNLVEWVEAHRSELVSAILTLIRAWIVADRPLVKHPPIGSFEGWADTMAGVLHVAGVRGFLENYEAMYEIADQDMDPWRMFVNAWWERFTSTQVTVADLEPLAIGLLDDVMGPGETLSKRQKLAHAIRRKTDRVISGCRISLHSEVKRKTYSLMKLVAPTKPPTPTQLDMPTVATVMPPPATPQIIGAVLLDDDDAPF
jgi:hypothetical protein